MVSFNLNIKAFLNNLIFDCFYNNIVIIIIIIFYKFCLIFHDLCNNTDLLSKTVVI